MDGIVMPRRESSPPFHVAYVEPEAGGHHVALWANVIFKSGIMRGWTWHWITSARSLEHPASRQLVDDCGEHVIPIVADFRSMPEKTGGGEWISYEYHHLRTVRQALRDLSQPVSAVYYAWLDYFPRAAGLMGLPSAGIPSCGLLMHPKMHHRQPSRSSRQRLKDLIHDRLTLRMMRNPDLGHFAVISEPFATYSKLNSLLPEGRLKLVPDIAQSIKHADREQTRRQLGILEENSVLLVYGGLSERKGIARLIAAFEGMTDARDWTILFAGKQNAMAAEQISAFRERNTQNGPGIIEWNHFLDSDEEARAFAVSDVCWMGYEETIDSSGVLLVAASTGMPVLSNSVGIIGDTTRRNNLGIALDIHDPAAVADALARLAKDSESRKRWKENGLQLARLHHPDSVADQILDMIADTAAGSNRSAR